MAVIGAGQAGLAVSHELYRHGIEHLVLERDRIGHAWRSRWESFCLVTPNWSIRLPGGAYAGDDPDGYLPRDGIVAHLERYASSFYAPVRGGIDVRTIDADDGSFALRTSDGPLRASRVVLATGAYQRPHRPEGASTLPAGLLQLDVEDYSSPQALPPGRILIVGSGQSGCQIAEELHEAGRDVVLSCGRAPWTLRRFGGRDVVWWLVRAAYFDQSLDTLPDPSARQWANVLATGHGGGHDLHLRTLRRLGVTLAGHFTGAAGNTARFAPNLGASVAWGDQRYRMLSELIRRTAVEQGLDVPELRNPDPFDPAGLEELDLSDVGAVLFAGGFRPDYRSWLPWTNAFDELGFPLHRDGASTVVPGLYFVGVHFLRTRKSSLLLGVGEDAALVADGLAADLARQ